MRAESRGTSTATRVPIVNKTVASPVPGSYIQVICPATVFNIFNSCYTLLYRTETQIGIHIVSTLARISRLKQSPRTYHVV